MNFNDELQRIIAERDRLRAALEDLTADRDSWIEQASARTADAVQFMQERDAARVEAESLRSLVEVLAQHDSYSTEYDGRMIALCPDCGGQDGTHTTGCVFVRAKAHIDAARAAQGDKT